MGTIFAHLHATSDKPVTHTEMHYQKALESIARDSAYVDELAVERQRKRAVWSRLSTPRSDQMHPDALSPRPTSAPNAPSTSFGYAARDGGVQPGVAPSPQTPRAPPQRPKTTNSGCSPRSFYHRGTPKTRKAGPRTPPGARGGASGADDAEKDKPFAPDPSAATVEVFRKGSSLDHTLKLKGSDPTVDHAQGTHYPVSYFSDWPFFVPEIGDVDLYRDARRRPQPLLRDLSNTDPFLTLNPTQTPARPNRRGERSQDVFADHSRYSPGPPDRPKPSPYNSNIRVPPGGSTFGQPHVGRDDPISTSKLIGGTFDAAPSCPTAATRRSLIHAVARLARGFHHAN